MTLRTASKAKNAGSDVYAVGREGTEGPLLTRPICLRSAAVSAILSLPVTLLQAVSRRGEARVVLFVVRVWD